MGRIWAYHRQEETADGIQGAYQSGCCPLAVLTRGGTDRSVLQEVVDELVDGERKDLLAVTKLFAGLVFTGDEDKRWLERMFAMKTNPLAKSWVYQEIL